MADLTLTDGTLQDTVPDDVIHPDGSIKNNDHDVKHNIPEATVLNSNSPENGTTSQKTHHSSKEEKQRQNEEIVILESSSLSSETGSWESVFPPRLSEKDICEKFINHERGSFCENPTQPQEISNLKIKIASNTPLNSLKIFKNSFFKELEADIAAKSWDDSCDKEGVDSEPEDVDANEETATDNDGKLSESTLNIGNDESETDINGSCDKKKFKILSDIPVLSGGASVEDHLPQATNYSPLSQKKIENIPIVSGAYYVPDSDKKPTNKVHKVHAETWTVDMTSVEKEEVEENKSSTEKKNIFSMFIDLGEKSSVKQMPARLNSSLSKKLIDSDTKSTPKNTTDSFFEKYEKLCDNPDISISEIVALPQKNLGTLLKKANNTTVLLKSENKKESEEPMCEASGGQQDREEKPAADNGTIPKQPKETTIHQPEAVCEGTTTSSGLFVKLSDLDKTWHGECLNNSKGLDMRMTRSIPDGWWGGTGGSNRGAANIPPEIISSFHSENALSLNRLFPHLQNEFNRSMPTGPLSSRPTPLRPEAPPSAGESEDPASDMSEMSSMRSSACRSATGFSAMDETSISTSSILYNVNCQSRLGKDLLRMFLEEIAPDVIVEVSGRRIKAHKCILSSRCEYFAGILSGGWVESAGNVIPLPPFAYNVVHFALCHIYSGTSHVPDTISIVELTSLADMLGLEGLKEAIMFTLKSNYCHFFHRPCPICTAGVLECFPLSSLYGLDDLFHKCLRWITKHFSKVWPTRAFATLPADLLERCFQQPVVNLTVENLADTVCGAGIALLALSGSSRECEVVERLCRRLISAAALFAGPRLVSVLRALAPLPAEDLPPCGLRAIDDCVLAAINCAPLEELCYAYGYLCAVMQDIIALQLTKPDLLSNGGQNIKVPAEDTLIFGRANYWRLQCEAALVRSAHRVVTTVSTEAFLELPPQLRQQLRNIHRIMYGSQPPPPPPNPPPAEPRNIPSAPRTKTKTRTRNIDMAHVRAVFIPYSLRPTTTTTTTINNGSRDVRRSDNDLRDYQKSTTTTKTVPPKVKTTKAQEERAKYNLAKKVQAHPNSTADKLSSKRTKPPEPKMQKSADYKMTATNKFIPKIISSSESSRNTSPIQMRARGLSSQQGVDLKGPTMSQDSLATSSRPHTAEPSTDSLSESHSTNKYATYTKMKHVKGSAESVQTSSKSQSSVQTTAKTKTKIPVSSNKTSLARGKLAENRANIDALKKPNVGGSSSTSVTSRGKTERKVPGSLMNATKSSSAKIVQKVSKDTLSKVPAKNKVPAKTNKPPGESSTNIPAMDRSMNIPEMDRSTNIPAMNRSTNIPAMDRSTNIPAMDRSTNIPAMDRSTNIPAMDRSGTFLKDEPTFGDKTTNLDIDQ